MESKHIKWSNVIFMLTLPVVGILSVIVLACLGMMHWQTWVLAGFLWYATGLAITAGYHRLFSHRSYEAHPLVRFLFVCFGSAAFEGSVFEWATDHRRHHRYGDTDKDPYGVNKGFWHAHLTWMFDKRNFDNRDFSNIEDLQKDPVLRFQDRFYIPIAAFLGFVAPALIAMLWGDFWGGLLIAGAFRMALMLHGTFCINSVCHMIGKKTYSKEQSARDHWLSSLVTFGEGYHNYHHQFPIDYRNGIRWYQHDPTKWLIFSLKTVGLAKNLKRVSASRIFRYKLNALHVDICQPGSDRLLEGVCSRYRASYQYVMSLVKKLEALEKQYNEVKGSQWVSSLKREYKFKLKTKKLQMNLLRSDLMRHVRVLQYRLPYVTA